MENKIQSTNPKKTSQNGFLEPILTKLRTKKIEDYTKNKIVLDFGCGEKLSTLRHILPRVKEAHGYDILYSGLPVQKTEDNISVYGNLSQIESKIEIITSLACFEHLEQDELKIILKDLSKVCTDKAQIIGTVPRPPAKPVLEFLSYRLKLIDPKQIKDHKIYYNKSTLEKILRGTPWTLTKYETFQLNMNSFFVLTKNS